MRHRAGLVIITLIFAILPQVFGGYYVFLFTKMLIFAIFAMSLNLLVGFLNLPSLGHAAFFGVAAYTIGILSKYMHQNFWLNFPLAIAVAGAIAAIFGLLILRTRGAYFFMITLALSQVLWGVAFSWRFLTRGDDGIPGIARPHLGIISWSLQDATNFYYFVFFFFVVAFALMHTLVRSPFGHVILGIRENELRMRTFGYNTWRYKYVWFVIAGLFAGLAGGLFVYFNGFVSPTALNVGMSAEALLMVLFGGSGTLFGPVIGAGALIFLENLVSSYTEHWPLILGIVFVIVVMITPQGLLGVLGKINLKRRGKG